MGEVQSPSLHPHRQRQVGPETPCMGWGPAEGFLPVDTGNQLVSDSPESH